MGHARKLTFDVDAHSTDAPSGLNLGYIHFTGVTNTGTNPIVDEILADASRKVMEKFKGADASQDPILKGIRSFFSHLGIDPTKDRPSGEALIKRVLGGKGLYRVNSVVDLNNAVSLLSGCPCGVYDAGKISGDAIHLVIGSPGQSYEGIWGKAVNGEGKILTADASGVFGGPVADSKRTCVRPETKEVLMLIYGPKPVGLELLSESMSKAIEYMKTATSANAEYSGVFQI
ncbi:MAG: phenylalanine--tRNA ligase beta subunit-related protein [Candidatus Micrarchaeota archaeon]